MCLNWLFSAEDSIENGTRTSLCTVEVVEGLNKRLYVLLPSCDQQQNFFFPLLSSSFWTAEIVITVQVISKKSEKSDGSLFIKGLYFTHLCSVLSEAFHVKPILKVAFLKLELLMVLNCRGKKSIVLAQFKCYKTKRKLSKWR